MKHQGIHLYTDDIEYISRAYNYKLMILSETPGNPFI